jgi:hypothetical protein
MGYVKTPAQLREVGAIIQKRVFPAFTIEGCLDSVEVSEWDPATESANDFVSWYIEKYDLDDMGREGVL